MELKAPREPILVPPHVRHCAICGGQCPPGLKAFCGKACWQAWIDSGRPSPRPPDPLRLPTGAFTAGRGKRDLF